METWVVWHSTKEIPPPPGQKVLIAGPKIGVRSATLRECGVFHWWRFFPGRYRSRRDVKWWAWIPEGAFWHHSAIDPPPEGRVVLAALAGSITIDVWVGGRFTRANTRSRMWCSVEPPPDDHGLWREEERSE